MRLYGAVVMALIGTGSLWSQSAPVKMGLWEKTMTMSGVSAQPDTIKSKSCVTPETWQAMTNNMKQRKECVPKLTNNGKTYTYEATCQEPGGDSVFVKGSTTIQDAEHIVSDTSSLMTIHGTRREMKTHSASRYLGASCGNIKPGEPETE